MPATLDDRRARSVARLATRVVAGLQHELASRPAARLAIPASQKAVLVQLEEPGNRISTLARRLRVSKQAASKLVAALEERRLVERRPDPSDGRASIIVFTARGRRLVEETVTVFEEVERRAARALGRRRVEALREELRALAEMLDPEGF